MVNKWMTEQISLNYSEYVVTDFESDGGTDKDALNRVNNTLYIWRWIFPLSALLQGTYFKQ